MSLLSAILGISRNYLAIPASCETPVCSRENLEYCSSSPVPEIRETIEAEPHTRGYMSCHVEFEHYLCLDAVMMWHCRERMDVLRSTVPFTTLSAGSIDMNSVADWDNGRGLVGSDPIGYRQYQAETSWVKPKDRHKKSNCSKTEENETVTVTGKTI